MKNFLTYISNEHGIECPAPLEFWPPKAKYCIVNRNNFAYFLTTKPTWGHGIWNIGDNFICDLWAGNVQGDYEKYLWEKPSV